MTTDVGGENTISDISDIRNTGNISSTDGGPSAAPVDKTVEERIKRVSSRKPSGDKFHPALGARIFSLTGSVALITGLTAAMASHQNNVDKNSAVQAQLDSLQQSLVNAQNVLNSLTGVNSSLPQNSVVNSVPQVTLPQQVTNGTIGKKPVVNGVMTTVKPAKPASPTTTQPATVPTNAPVTTAATTTTLAPAPCVTTVSGKCK